MASASLPPWLDINPTQNLIESAQIGASMGESARRQGDEEMNFQQSLQMKGAELAASVQESQARVAQAAQSHQLATQELQLETQKAQVAAQEAQMKMSMEWQEAGKKYQAQQKYQQLYQQFISQGLSPDDAATRASMAVGPGAMGGGDTLAGMASLAKMNQPARLQDFGGGVKGIVQPGVQPRLVTKADMPESMNTAVQVKDENGNPIEGVYNAGGTIINKNKDANAELVIKERRRASLERSLDAAEKRLTGVVRFKDGSNKALVDSMEKRRDDIVKQIDALDSGSNSSGDEGDSGAAKAGTDKDPLGLFTK